MLFGIKSIDISAAEKLPGVLAVVTGADLPNLKDKMADLGEGSVNLAHESGSVPGWQVANFASPIPISDCSLALIPAVRPSRHHGAGFPASRQSEPAAASGRALKGAVTGCCAHRVVNPEGGRNRGWGFPACFLSPCATLRPLR